MITKIIPYKQNTSYKFKEINKACSNPAFRSHGTDTFSKAIPLKEAVVKISQALSDGQTSFEQNFLKPSADIALDQFKLILRTTETGKINLVVRYLQPGTEGESTIARGSVQELLGALNHAKFESSLIEHLQESSDKARGF